MTTARLLRTAVASAALALSLLPGVAHAATGAPPVKHVAGGPPVRAAVLTATGKVRSDTTAAIVTAL